MHSSRPKTRAAAARAITWRSVLTSLRGAAMASRRIRLATRAPLCALWDAVGGAGKPPHDQSRKFALVAIVVTTLTWFVVPVAIAIVFLT